MRADDRFVVRSVIDIGAAYAPLTKSRSATVDASRMRLSDAVPRSAQGTRQRPRTPECATPAAKFGGPSRRRSSTLAEFIGSSSSSMLSPSTSAIEHASMTLANGPDHRGRTAGCPALPVKNALAVRRYDLSTYALRIHSFQPEPRYGRNPSPSRILSWPKPEPAQLLSPRRCDVTQVSEPTKTHDMRSSSSGALVHISSTHLRP